MADVEKAQQTDAEREEQARVKLTQLLSDRTWRLNNLYWVQDEDGRKVKFRMNWAQRQLYNALWWLNVVLKARQLGVSTFALLFALDKALFTPNQTCGLIDKTDDDAKKKLSRIQYAYEHLDDPDDQTTAGLGVLIKQAVKVVTENKREFELTNGSKIWAGTGLRGGTVQFLHISELGYIAYNYPDKAKEIRAGALNTVHAGNIVLIESTHEGGKYGLNYDMVKLAQEAPRVLTKLDWRFHFFPWHKHPNYKLPLSGTSLVLTPEQIRYFSDLETRESIPLTDEQKHWYTKKQKTLGDAMAKEFPSTPEEALNAVVSGAIYGQIMSRLRRDRRLVDFEHNRIAQLYAFADVGMSDFTTWWLIQLVGQDILWLNCFERSGEAPPFYVAKLMEWEKQYGMPISKHYFPHDANNRGPEGKSYLDYYIAAGMTRYALVPRTPDVWVGINHLRSLLPRSYFHLSNCSQEWKKDDRRMPSGIGALESYHTQQESTAGIIKEMPVHDDCSHFSDAARTFAEAHMRGMLEGVSMVARSSKRQRERDDFDNDRSRPRVLTGVRGSTHTGHRARR